jgi:hypothetical protein
MSGVEILSIIEKPVLLFNEEAFGIALFISVVIFFFVGSYMAITESEWIYFPLFSVAGIMIGVLLGLMIGGILAQKTDEVETTYKVIVSEEVSVNEFLDKYEIIDQEDKIYTVRERGE